LTSFLIVRLGALGDVVHAVPFAAALRAALPQARIDWAVDPRYVELLDLVTVLDRRIALDPRWLVRGAARARLRQTLADLREVGYDVVFDLQGLLKSALLSRAVGASRVVGFPRRHLREPLARLFYTSSPDPGRATHVIDRNLALLAAIGVQDRRVRFPVSVPESGVVDSIVQRFGRGGFVVMNPGAAWPNKRWPAERFGRVAEVIRERYGLRSLVLRGPGEQALAHDVADAARGAADAAPPTGIREIAGVAHAARLMISGDTGPMHIAAAVGTPLVTLFGPTRPERNGPWALYDVAISRVDRCSCVYERKCRLESPCIEDIGVDEVLAAVERRLAAHG
jgi:lipopolysaccharide heptosyltransferase I